MSKEVTANLSATLEPVTLAQVTDRAAYIGVANQLISGVELLGKDTNAAPIALTMLAAHAAECLLKAVLAVDSATETDLRNGRDRHNLKALWGRAVKQGLAVTATPPEWIDRLSYLHDRPFFLRYSRGVQGLALLNMSDMIAGLVALRDTVRQNLR